MKCKSTLLSNRKISACSRFIFIVGSMSIFNLRIVSKVYEIHEHPYASFSYRQHSSYTCPSTTFNCKQSFNNELLRIKHSCNQKKHPNHLVNQTTKLLLHLHRYVHQSPCQRVECSKGSVFVFILHQFILWDHKTEEISNVIEKLT